MPPGAKCPVGSKKAERVPPACFCTVLGGPARTKAGSEERDTHVFRTGRRWPMRGDSVQREGAVLSRAVRVCSSSLRPSCWMQEYRPPGHPCTSGLLTPWW